MLIFQVGVRFCVNQIQHNVRFIPRYRLSFKRRTRFFSLIGCSKSFTDLSGEYTATAGISFESEILLSSVSVFAFDKVRFAIIMIALFLFRA